MERYGSTQEAPMRKIRISSLTSTIRLAVGGLQALAAIDALL